MVCDGALRPEMDKIFPLAEATAAHTYMESGAHVGKIMLAV
jgi:NADPH:quinone reductase-like Zn-dependent oxidoreductase